MPKWGIEMTEGTVNAWHVAAGAAVSKGDALLDVETEKIVNTVEAPASGTLRRLLADAGAVYPVGALLGVLAPAEVADSEIEAFIAAFIPERVSFDSEEGFSREGLRPSTRGPGATVEARGSSAGARAPTRSGDVVPAPASGDSHVSPIARRIAEQLGVDLSQVRGTGRNGRISKEDVEAYAASQTTGNRAIRKPLTATRATIATRLQQSTQTIPHYRVTVTAIADRIMTLRRGLIARSVDVSLNDIIIRATALALTRHRALNARFEDNELSEYDHADIAIAVATGNGLITPVLRRADQKSIEEIARASADLTARARSGALTRSDLEGGTFTISNLGMFGIEQFDAIINPPQVAILAVGSVHPAVVAHNGTPAVMQVMTLTLSSDHRIVDGAIAAQFLGTLRTLIEMGDL
jgi:pyruvate dehydrogenase E2 component (dihydrolipoyllysine-residue acetyltransferase)